MDGWQRNHRVHIYLDKQINKKYNPNTFLLFTLHILQITFCVTASWKGEEVFYLFTTLHHSSSSDCRLPTKVKSGEEW